MCESFVVDTRLRLVRQVPRGFGVDNANRCMEDGTSREEFDRMFDTWEMVDYVVMSGGNKGEDQNNSDTMLRVNYYKIWNLKLC